METKFYDSEGSDRYIRQHFFPDPTFKGVMIDVGACEDEWLSISKHFLVSGWTVLSIEANPLYATELKKHRPNVYQVAVSDTERDDAPFAVYDIGIYTKMASFSGLELQGRPLHPSYPSCEKLYPKPKMVVPVKVRTLNSLIDEYNCEHISATISRVDVLSVDVEGNELNVLKGFDLNKYAPRVLVIEECGEMGIRQYLQQFGYAVHGRVSSNVIYYKRS